MIYKQCSTEFFNYPFDVCQYSPNLLFPNFSTLSTINKNIFQNILEVYKENLSVFTDGSKSELGTGCAYYIPELEIGHKFKLPTEASIFTAEAFAIQEFLRIAEYLNFLNVTIYSDSKSVLSSIINCKGQSSPIIVNIVAKLARLSQRGIAVNLVWVKAHCGLTQNEIVDNFAKEAAVNGILIPVKIPVTDIFAIYKKKLFMKWQNLYDQKYMERGTNYYYLNPLITKSRWYDDYPISRPFYSTITRLQFNHGRFPEHLFKIGIQDNNLCACGQKGDIDHIFFNCTLHSVESTILVNKLKIMGFQLPMNINYVLQSKKVEAFRLVYEFLSKCGIVI